MTIQFSDRAVPYAVFLNDLADALAERIRKKDEPEYICPNEAFRRFGRSNVERWRDTGKIEPCKRTQKWNTRSRSFNGSKIPNKTISGSQHGRVDNLNWIEAG